MLDAHAVTHRSRGFRRMQDIAALGNRLSLRVYLYKSECSKLFRHVDGILVTELRGHEAVVD